MHVFHSRKMHADMEMHSLELTDLRGTFENVNYVFELLCSWPCDNIVQYFTTFFSELWMSSNYSKSLYTFQVLYFEIFLLFLFIRNIIYLRDFQMKILFFVYHCFLIACFRHQFQVLPAMKFCDLIRHEGFLQNVLYLDKSTVVSMKLTHNFMEVYKFPRK